MTIFFAFSSFSSTEKSKAYALDLKEWARGEEEEAKSKDWRALAISLETQLRQLRADDLHREKPGAKRGKQTNPPATLPLPPTISDLSSILRQALTVSLPSPSKLDTFRTRIVPEMAWALFESILAPAVQSFQALSVQVFNCRDRDNPDSRPSLLRLVQHCIKCISRDTRKDVGMLAIDLLSIDPKLEPLATKDARWYLLTVISLCDVGRKGAEAICKFLEAESDISLVEKEMVEGVLEQIWLAMEDAD